MIPLPHVLAPLTLSDELPDLAKFHTRELRKIATFWHVPATKVASAIAPAIKRAWSNEESGRLVAADLTTQERTILGVFRRQGGYVDGEVLRLDLLARGVLEIKTEGPGGVWRSWANNPVEHLAEHCALVEVVSDYEEMYYSTSEVLKPFSPYQIHPRLAKWVEPAGPPPWQVPHLKETVQALPAEPPAQTALCLGRLSRYLATSTKVKLTKQDILAVPSIKALQKAVPLPDNPDFPLPAPQGLGVELLRINNVVVPDEEGRLMVAQQALNHLFALPSVHQAHAWVRGWLFTRGWVEGFGVTDLEEGADYRNAADERQVLAWYLTALAGEPGTPWIGLEAFLDVVHASVGAGDWAYWEDPAGWDPALSGTGDSAKKSAKSREKAKWLSYQGRWYANALMITLPWLGVVERGRTTDERSAKEEKQSPWCFRLTALGKGVFAAPDVVEVPPEPSEPFLVVQPNFDVIAYLDQTGLATAATLGCMTEPDQGKTPASGPVQTMRLTPASIYLALEAGMSQAEIIAFLERYSRNELPGNILQSVREWSARRETMAVRSGVDFLAFPSPQEADAWLAGGNKGTRIGDRIIQVAKRKGKDAKPTVDHAGARQKTWTVDEKGRIDVTGVPDLVQTARLWRLAEHMEAGWRLSRQRTQEAAKGGLKLSTIREWLAEHLARQLPPIFQHALDAWASKPNPAALTDVVALQVPDPDVFTAIRKSKRFKPFLVRKLGPGWLLVRGDKRKELQALLEELGFAVGAEVLPEQED